MTRPIDLAMTQMRPSKVKVRKAWLSTLKEQNEILADGRVLYLTLAGASALDIQMMFDAGLLRRTESGAITEEDANRVVAIERSTRAAAAVKLQFPGLQVIQRDLHQLLRIDDGVAFPARSEHHKYTAAVVNLDYDSNLSMHDHQIEAIEAIRKIARLQTIRKQDWVVLLTANAGVLWSDGDVRNEQQFVGYFSDGIDEVSKYLSDLDGEDCLSPNKVLSGSPGVLQQVFLSLHLPLRIADALIGEGWQPRLASVFIYGGTGEALMVSVIMEALWSGSTGGLLAKRMSLIREICRSIPGQARWLEREDPAAAES